MKKGFFIILLLFFVFLSPAKSFAVETIHIDTAEWLNSHTLRFNYSQNIYAPNAIGLNLVESDGSFHAGAMGYSSSHESGYVDFDAQGDMNALYWGADPGYTRYYALTNDGGFENRSNIVRLSAYVESTPIVTPNPTTLPTPTSTPIAIPTPTIIDPMLLKVSILFPLNNTKVFNGTKVSIYAEAFPKQKITKLEFYVNDSLLCTDKKQLYTCSWKVPRGKGAIYKITAKAYGKLGNVAVSKVITVTSK